MYVAGISNGAWSALRILSGVDRARVETSSRISSGLRIREASDNPAMWSVASTMRAQASTTRGIADGLSMTVGALDVASTATQRLLPLLERFRDLMVAGKNETGDARRTMQNEMDALKTQMVSVAKSASFNGVNLLFHRQGEAYELNAVTGLGADGSAITQTINTEGLTLIDEVNTNGILSRTYNLGSNTFRKMFDDYGGNAFRIGLYFNATTPANGFAYDGALAATNSMISQVTSVAARIGAMKSSFESQQSFLRTLADVHTTAIGRMVDANMMEEQVRSKALEVREKLAIDGLAIANARHSAVLQLFGLKPAT